MNDLIILLTGPGSTPEGGANRTGLSVVPKFIRTLYRDGIESQNPKPKNPKNPYQNGG
jgi:hypothetical protein